MSHESTTSVIDFLGLHDARLLLPDWSLRDNPFWTSFAFTIISFPCLFYLTWHLNPSLSKNRLGLSWVLGFYSASLFTLAGFYEVPHLRTIFNSAVDFQPATSVSPFSQGLSTTAPLSESIAVCYPILTLALAATLPSCLWTTTGDTDSIYRAPKYYCFSDLDQIRHENPLGGTGKEELSPVSLRHRVYQAQMERSHLVFSLENYPDDGRIGPHLIAGNFQAFLVVDLVLGFIHYRKQLEVFSTVIHHIIYYFIVVHMRAGDMLSVFCICGTPIEGTLAPTHRLVLHPYLPLIDPLLYGKSTDGFHIHFLMHIASSIFLAYGRMFPQRRTKTVERLYLLCFISTRLIYVSLLWHEIYYNYPDKSVSFLYTITVSLHAYWFVLYLQTQKRFQVRQRRQHLCSVLESLASSVREEIAVLETSALAIKENLGFTLPSPLPHQQEQRHPSLVPISRQNVVQASEKSGLLPPSAWSLNGETLDETGLPLDVQENQSAIDDQVAGEVLRPSPSRNVSSRKSYT